GLSVRAPRAGREVERRRQAPSRRDRWILVICIISLRRQMLEASRAWATRSRSSQAANHLNRASLSVAANIAEGNGRSTKADRRKFFGIGRGCVQECVPLLELALRRGLLSTEVHSVPAAGYSPRSSGGGAGGGAGGVGDCRTQARK